MDGIVLGAGYSTANLMEFNPAVTNNNPVAYVRGILGDSSRVTTWSLGDDTVNLNNTPSGFGHIVDFTGGRLNALVGTLIVGQGSQGNTANLNLMGTFNMGLGNLDVTTLQIGVSDNGKTGGTGIGIMNVTGGTVVANALGLGVGNIATSAGTLNLTNATFVVSNTVTIGSGSANLNFVSSAVKLLNSTTVGATLPLTTLNLDGAILQLNVDGNVPTAKITATTITTNNPTAINIGSIVNVGGTVQIPLISYTGNDPYGALTLGTYPAGYTATLVDNTGSSSVDLSITSTVKPTPHITSITVSGPTLTIQGTNGANSGPYVLLGSTNVALPLIQWTPLLTNNFAPDGSFNLSTNIINPALPLEFYILSQ
jgi:hypothetical protein